MVTNANPFARYLQKLRDAGINNPQLEIRRRFKARGRSLSTALVSMWANDVRIPTEENQLVIEQVCEQQVRPLDWMEWRLQRARAAAEARVSTKPRRSRTERRKAIAQRR